MEEIQREIKQLQKHGRFGETKKLIQHATITVHNHCIHVAYLSVNITNLFNVQVDRKSLIRGALLYDYFLYDWHKKERYHSFHGFQHPFTAVKRARE